MEHRLDTVDPGSLAPAYRVLFEGLRAEVVALTERNRELERQEPEAVVEGLRSRVASLTEHNGERCSATTRWRSPTRRLSRG